MRVSNSYYLVDEDYNYDAKDGILIPVGSRGDYLLYHFPSEEFFLACVDFEDEYKKIIDRCTRKVSMEEGWYDTGYFAFLDKVGDYTYFVGLISKCEDEKSYFSVIAHKFSKDGYEGCEKLASVEVDGTDIDYVCFEGTDYKVTDLDVEVKDYSLVDYKIQLEYCCNSFDKEETDEREGIIYISVGKDMTAGITKEEWVNRW